MLTVGPEWAKNGSQFCEMLICPRVVRFYHADKVRIQASDICDRDTFLDGAKEFAVDILKNVADIVVINERIAVRRDCWNNG